MAIMKSLRLAKGGVATKVKSRPDTPFPLKQLLILSLARFVEPIAYMSIFPYIYYMIQSFNITTDDRQISVYAGMVTSSFAVAECSCSAMWGRLSDKIGRKPVLLIGLSGTGISMLTFGFAKSLWVALAARFVGGLLNGNGGVLQTMVAEVVTVREHQPRAYTFLPLTWGLGSVIGAFLGGTLANPVANYPELFPNGNAMLEKYPFLLPNLFAACMVVFGVTVAALFFQETHPTIRFQRDRGIEFGDLLIRVFTRKAARTAHQRHKAKRSDLTGSVDLTERNEEEAEGWLLKDEIELVDSPSSATWRNSVATLVADTDTPPNEKDAGLDKKAFGERVGLVEELKVTRPRSSVRAAFTPQVVLNMFAYGILAFHTICLDQLLPVYLSLPPATIPSTSLFHFTGGLGMSSLSIGWIFSGQAIYSMFFQLLLAPPIIRRLGYLRCFRLTAFTYPFLYLLMPYITLLSYNYFSNDNLSSTSPSTTPTPAQWTAITLACIWKTSFNSLAYLTILILLTNSVKEGGNEAQMGVVNGMSASFASGARAVGPTVAGWLFNVGESRGTAVLVWWCVAGMAVVGAVESVWMRAPRDELEDGGVELTPGEYDDEEEEETIMEENHDDEAERNIKQEKEQ